MLEDLLVAAFNDAARKVEATVAEKMGSLTAGMGLPAGLKLPFYEDRKAKRDPFPARRASSA